MTTSAVVHAQWALLSKPPADTGDYRVLACSEGAGRFTEFEDLVRDTLFGTPPHWTAGRRQPGENLPWISFGVSGDGRRAPRRVSISVTDWQAGTGVSWDSARRLSVATRYFAVRYADLARCGAGLTELWNAVRPVVLPPEPDADAGPVPLRLDTDRLPRLARLLDEEDGFGWAAATAAVALTGPVGLVAGSSRFALTRIETMDRVISLLPYGYRSAMTAATWAPEPWPRNPWLCYTHQATAPDRAETASLPPSSLPLPARLMVRERVTPEPTEPAARAHLARLLALRAESGTLGCLRVLAAVGAPATLPYGPPARPDRPGREN